jgi:hypothetical protein
MEHSTHCVLRFDVGMCREIVHSLLQALQRRSATPTHHYRTCISHRNRYVTVVHASSPKTLPMNAQGESNDASLRPDVHAPAQLTTQCLCEHLQSNKEAGL